MVFAEKYKLEKLIGEGAFGKIYSGTTPTFTPPVAKNMETHEAVAVKLVRRRRIA